MATHRVDSGVSLVDSLVVSLLRSTHISDGDLLFALLAKSDN